MTTTIRILHLEDEDNDAALVKAQLDASGLDYRLVRIKSMDELSAALMEETFDLIISDYAGPQFDGENSLAMSREKSPQTPFIFVSGTMGEDVAVQSLLNGATDYILKTGSMKRLGPAIQRALREAQERSKKASLESQLQQAQKIESIGRLAGGVAHDFNNILTAISGYSYFLLETVKPGDAMRGDIEEIQKAAGRAAALTRQLLAFSRQQVLQPVILDLNAVVRGIENMLRRLVSEDMTISSALAADLGRVNADPGQLEQIIVNLVVNARDAMPGGGTVKIETANVELSEDFAKSHLGSLPGPHVMLAVTDEGTGMDEKTKARLFEPFFTTKELGKGTGLGLSTVYGIVKQSGGWIYAESEPGKGSAFRIYLPRSEEAAAPLPGARKEAAAAGGSETILLVEDDEPLRKFVSRLLAKSGYHVIEASDPDAALLAAAGPEGCFDLLLTDVVMPVMKGEELARTLEKGRPGMKVIFMSGYTQAGLIEHELTDSRSAFIPKPLEPAALLGKIRALLDAPG